MTKDDPARSATRAERLAEALRTNLRRRKAQARAIEAGEETIDPSPLTPPAPPSPR